MTPWTPPKWCTAWHYDPDATCEMKHGHAGIPRAEIGPPIRNDKGVPIAQIVSWQ